MEPPPPPNPSVLQIVQDIINFTRSSGVSNTVVRFATGHRFTTIPLVEVYGIYAAVTNLRNHFSKVPRAMHDHLYEFNQKGLFKGLALCEGVRPKEIVAMIKSALEDEFALHRYGQLSFPSCRSSN